MEKLKNADSSGSSALIFLEENVLVQSADQI